MGHPGFIGSRMMRFIAVVACVLGVIASSQGLDLGSVDAEIGEFPWHAVLKVNGTFRCGATLITDKWLMTARRCCEKYIPWHTIVLADGKEYTLDHVILEGDNIMTQDMAKLRIRRPADMSSGLVKPLTLPAKGEYFGNMDCVVSGYGGMAGVHVDKLQKQEVHVLNRKECDAPLMTEEDGGRKEGRMNHICAVSKDQSTGACAVDVGGPLACNKDGEWKFVGIASYPNKSCSPGTPSVFTYVPYYHHRYPKKIRDEAWEG